MRGHVGFVFVAWRVMKGQSKPDHKIVGIQRFAIDESRDMAVAGTATRPVGRVVRDEALAGTIVRRVDIIEGPRFKAGPNISVASL